MNISLNLAVSTTLVNAGDSVSLQVSNIYPPVTAFGLYINWGDGTPPGWNIPANHQYAAGKKDPYVISVQATGRYDGSNLSTGSLYQFVTVPLGDDAVATSVVATQSADLCVGFFVQAQSSFTCLSDPPPLIVSFVSTVSGGTPPYTYLWDFGDGTTSSESNPTHTYAGVGPYNASVTITDSLGASDTSNLIVSCTSTGLISTNLMFIDSPTHSRKQVMEYPITDRENDYLSENAQGPFYELPIFVIAGRHNSLIPTLGYVPTFADNWNINDGWPKKDLYVWGFPYSEDPSIFVLNIAARGAAGSKLNYLSQDGTKGGMTLRIMGANTPEIIGLRAAPYLDKQGCSLYDPDGSGGNTALNSTYLRIQGGGYTAGAHNHMLVKNPYSTLADPPDELFPGEDANGTSILSNPPATLEDGEDKFRWVDGQTALFGFQTAVNSRGLRFYIKDWQWDTLCELSIDETGARDRFLGAWIGPNRIMSYGVPGDKVRWFVARRCGEPGLYIPAYGLMTDLNIQAEATPATCLKASSDGGGGGGGGNTDLPPTVVITSGPTQDPGGGGGGSISVDTPTFSRDCGGPTGLLTMYMVDAVVHGGLAPIQFTARVQVSSAGIDVTRTASFDSTDTDLTLTFQPPQYAGGGNFQIDVTVTDSLGATATASATISLTANSC